MKLTFSGENLQRVGVLAAVPQILRRFGVNPGTVLAAAGLGGRALDNPEDTIPYKDMGLLAEAAADQTQCPHFGLLVGAQIKTSSLGLVGELMRNAPTVRDALQDFAAHQHRNAHGAVVYLLSQEDHAFFGYAVYHPHMSGSAVICDAVASGLFSLVQELAVIGCPPILEIRFCRREPIDLTHYRQSLPVKLCFDAEQTAVMLPRPLLDSPVIGADRARRAVLKQRVMSIWHSGDLDTSTRLRRALRIALIQGQVSAEKIAAQFGLARRTFDRRLKADGLQFREVLDETRCEFTEHLLMHTRLGVGEIAAVVGYGDASVLTRSFIRWTGISPSAWRLRGMSSSNAGMS